MDIIMRMSTKKHRALNNCVSSPPGPSHYVTIVSNLEHNLLSFVRHFMTNKCLAWIFIPKYRVSCFLFENIIVLKSSASRKRDKITINQTPSPRRTESDVITHNGRHEISIHRAIVGYLLIRIWDVIHFAANLVTIKYRLSTPLPHYPDVQDKSSEKRLTGASESMG